MEKHTYNIIGVMSGTSLDGVDLVFIEFQFNGFWHFEIKHFETVAYQKQWLEQLQKLVYYPIEKLQQIDADYTVYLSKIINNFIKKNTIKHIDAICSHGHTALHQPQKRLTYQIGNKPILANLLQHTVVCDFRIQDVELGGQGAPLVPIGDRLLFSKYDYCLNLGGFANISTEIKNKRIAYDICPVNSVLNLYAHQLGFDYDEGGKIASTGIINNTLLSQLNALSYYQEAYPKSLGIEWVNTHVFPLIDSFKMEIKDILKTVVEHISNQIALEINKKNMASVLITGGGAYNTFLINRIQALSKHTLVIPKKEVIEYKEALIFGLLGVLKLRDQVNCLKSVTGAKRDHSSGKIYLHKNNN